MNRDKLNVLLLSSLLLMTGFVRAQTPLGPKDTTNPPTADLNRLKVGDEASDFTLEDQDAKPITLSSYRGKKKP